MAGKTRAGHVVGGALSQAPRIFQRGDSTNPKGRQVMTEDFVDGLKKALGKGGMDWMALAREYLDEQDYLLLHGPTWFADGVGWRYWSPIDRRCRMQIWPRQRLPIASFIDIPPEQFRSRLYTWMDGRGLKPTTYKIRELDAALRALRSGEQIERAMSEEEESKTPDCQQLPRYEFWDAWEEFYEEHNKKMEDK
jgi:hypothetical protein